MNDYRQVRVDMSPAGDDASDLMAAFLADIGFESFVPDEGGLTAYIPAELFDREALAEVCASFPMQTQISFSDVLVEGQDWNSEWEKNYFQPIVVGQRCVIHSTFHTDVPAAEYDIVIDPKMAFGTGHHATTSQVIEALLNLDLHERTLIDMGTGTAILAILASMLGAKQVSGIEIDGFAFENAKENVRLNNRSNIILINGDATALDALEPADIFVANINRNVITADIHRYAAKLLPGGTMLLSGFYVEDIPVVMAAAAPLGLEEVSHSERDRWTCLVLKKQAQQS